MVTDCLSALAAVLLISSMAVAGRPAGARASAQQYRARQRSAAQDFRPSECRARQSFLERTDRRGLADLGMLTMGWERSIEILNFGALMTFMAVNLAAVKHFGFYTRNSAQAEIVPRRHRPWSGLCFLPGNFSGLQGSTLVVGTAWLAMGGLYVYEYGKDYGAAGGYRLWRAVMGTDH